MPTSSSTSTPSRSASARRSRARCRRARRRGTTGRCRPPWPRPGRCRTGTARASRPSCCDPAGHQHAGAASPHARPRGCPRARGSAGRAAPRARSTCTGRRGSSPPPRRRPPGTRGRRATARTSSSAGSPARASTASAGRSAGRARSIRSSRRRVRSHSWVRLAPLRARSLIGTRRDYLTSAAGREAPTTRPGDGPGEPRLREWREQRRLSAEPGAPPPCWSVWPCRRAPPTSTSSSPDRRWERPSSPRSPASTSSSPERRPDCSRRWSRRSPGAAGGSAGASPTTRHCCAARSGWACPPRLRRAPPSCSPGRSRSTSSATRDGC